MTRSKLHKEDGQTTGEINQNRYEYEHGSQKEESQQREKPVDKTFKE